MKFTQNTQYINTLALSMLEITQHAIEKQKSDHIDLFKFFSDLTFNNILLGVFQLQFSDLGAATEEFKTFIEKNWVNMKSLFPEN